jgi:hypothetical protein
LVLRFGGTRSKIYKTGYLKLKKKILDKKTQGQQRARVDNIKNRSNGNITIMGVNNQKAIKWDTSGPVLEQ